jgi:hypothetical protein
MTDRPAPAPTDTITYDLDEIKAGANGSWDTWPTLRQILDYATTGSDSGLYGDPERAEEYAATLDRWHHAVNVPGPFVITVADAQQLQAAARAYLDYALENNYGAEHESVEDPEAYRFAQFGPILLSALSHPWDFLSLANDAANGWTISS